MIMQDKSIWLLIEKSVHGDGPFSWGPAEILGFNTGNMVIEDTTALQGVLVIETNLRRI